MNPPANGHPRDPAKAGTSWGSLALVILLAFGGNELWQWRRDQNIADKVRRHVHEGSIILYTTSTCPYCADARHWLDTARVPWRECNVETSSACMSVFEGQGSPGTPLVQANGRWRLGFDPAWVAQALEAPPLGPPPPQPSPRTSSSPRP